MSLRDPAARTATGIRLQAEITGRDAAEASSPFEASWRDFVFAEIWSRPGLDRRARFLIAVAGAACAGDAGEADRYVHGMLAGDVLTLAEAREAALHVAVYGGWGAGGIVDRAVSKAAEALALDPAPFDPIRAEPWDPAERHAIGAASFKHNMLFGGPPPRTAYFEGGILNFVFGEMWNRPGLDQRSRRWLTLVGVGFSSAVTPIGSHVWTAMASGNATGDEMFEFVLQYAVHAGWPRGSVMQNAVLEQVANVSKKLDYQGKEPR